MIVLNIPFPLVFLFWHFCTCVLAIFNFALYVRFQTTLLEENLRNTYLAFCVIGMLTYAGAGGPCFFTAYKYSNTQKSRSRRLRIGIVAMFFGSTLPIFAIELYIMYLHRVVWVLQGITFCLFFISWFFEAFSVWFIYMWQVARFMHIRTGTDRLMMFSQQQQRRQEQRVPPIMGLTKPLPGQPDIV